MEDFDRIAYKKAKDKVKEIKGFYYNLMCYCTVLPILVYINLTYSPQFHWFWFSALGWGIGVLFHGMGAFGYIPFLGRNWEARKLKELMEEEEKNKQDFDKIK